MYTTTSFMPIVMALLSFNITAPISKPISNPAALLYVPKDDKPLTQPEMDRLLESLKQNFVPLMSKDSKNLQSWGILYKSRDTTGILLRSLDAFQYSKHASTVLEVSGNSSLVVLDRWNDQPEKGSALSLDVASRFYNFLEGEVSGTFVYPGRNGRIQHVPLELDFVRKSWTVTSSLLPNHHSGVGIFVTDAGKLLPIQIDVSDKTISTYNDLNYNFPQIVSVFLLKGRGLYVDPLSNIDSIAINVSVFDEVTMTFESSKVTSKLKNTLLEVCPRLIITPERLRDLPLSDMAGEYHPRSTVDREAVSNLLGNYNRLLVPSLKLSYRRKRDGSYCLQLEVVTNVESIGGSTMASLYTNFVTGFNKSKSELPLSPLKELIKDFAAKWEKANPIENHRGGVYTKS